MQQAALLIIDMINDFQFEHGPILAKKCKAMLPNLLQLKQKMKKQGCPIIYVNDHYNLWQANVKTIMQHCENAANYSILQEIQPAPDDFFLIKPHYSAFYETPLNSLLGHLKIQHLVVTGIAGNICVLFTAGDAHMRNYKLYVPSDCIASNKEEDNAHALAFMQTILQANTCSSAEL